MIPETKAKNFNGDIIQPNKVLIDTKEVNISWDEGKLDLSGIQMENSKSSTFQGICKELVERSMKFEMEDEKRAELINELIRNKNLFKNGDPNLPKGRVVVTSGGSVDASVGTASLLKVGKDASAKDVEIGIDSRVYVGDGANIDHLRVTDHSFVYVRGPVNRTQNVLKGICKLNHTTATQMGQDWEYQLDYEKKLNKFCEFQTKVIENDQTEI